MTEESRTPMPGQGDDEALVSLIAENTEWGDRSEFERRAFEARLAARGEQRANGRRWRLPAVGGGLVATAVALALVWSGTGTLPTSEAVASGSGGSFLSTAYYGGAMSDDGDGTTNSYWPDDYQGWAEALDAAEANSS